MNDLPLSFNSLFEQYLFSIADRFIGFADSDEQQQLIRLITSIDASDPLGDSEPVPASLRPLKTEWQQELAKPVDLASIHRQWQLGMVRQQISRYEAYIAHLERALHDSQHHYQLGQTLSSVPKHHASFRYLVSQYQRYLVQANKNLDVSINRLSQLAG